ncbi:MAG: AI-2E family transporter [Trueperaceae bacterium]|nr:AI-2E family transporter [Trueperaceae bacterium]
MIGAVRTVWANPYVRVLVAVLLLVALYFGLRAVKPAVVVFGGALALAYVVNPLVGRLERLGARRGFGVALIYSVLAVGAVFAVRLLAGLLNGMVHSGDDGPALAESVVEFLDDLPANLNALLPPQVAGVLEEPVAALGTGLEQALQNAVPQFAALGGNLLGFVSGTLAGAFQLFLILVVTAYVLYDYRGFSKVLTTLIPKPYQEQVSSLAARLDTVMGAFIRGQLLVSLGVGLMVWLGLMILGVSGSAAIGLFAGLMNLVPFLGSVVPAIPAVFMVMSEGWVPMLLVIGVFVLVNQIDNHLLTPLILGRTTDLHPVTVIVSVVGGFSAFGLLGGILAVPICAFIKVLYVEFYLPSRLYRKG